MDAGGTILCFAPTEPGVELPIPVNPFWRNQMTLTTSYGAGPFDLQQTIDIIKTKRIPLKEMITHRFGLADIARGFRLVAEANESIKVLIEPHKSNENSHKIYNFHNPCKLA